MSYLEPIYIDGRKDFDQEKNDKWDPRSKEAFEKFSKQHYFPIDVINGRKQDANAKIPSQIELQVNTYWHDFEWHKYWKFLDLPVTKVQKLRNRINQGNKFNAGFLFTHNCVGDRWAIISEQALLDSYIKPKQWRDHDTGKLYVEKFYQVPVHLTNIQFININQDFETTECQCHLDPTTNSEVLSWTSEPLKSQRINILNQIKSEVING